MKVLSVPFLLCFFIDIVFMKTSVYLQMIWLALFLLVSSCSSNKHQPPKLRELFSTYISEFGKKQFQLSIEHDMPAKHRSGRGGPPPGKGSGPPPDAMGGPGGKKGERGKPHREDKLDIRDRLHHKLESIIQENGYCRDGYTIHSESFGFKAGNQSVRGQCTESATKNDRQIFPNPKVKKGRVVYESFD